MPEEIDGKEKSERERPRERGGETEARNAE
jgi:hypothetical protein